MKIRYFYSKGELDQHFNIQSNYGSLDITGRFRKF